MAMADDSAVPANKTAIKRNIERGLMMLAVVVCLAYECRPAVDAKNVNWDDVTDFEELVVNDLLVDKSLMIKRFIGAGEVVRITRPSGWGKTTNVDMLRRFLEIELDADGKPLPEDKRRNRLLFAGGSIALAGNRTKLLKPLKVAGEKNLMQVQGWYPVIAISLRNVTGLNFAEIEKKLKRLIGRLFEERAHYLRDGLDAKDTEHYDALRECRADGPVFEQSLLFLSHLLNKRFGRTVFLLVDDYDVPVVNTMLQSLYKVRFMHSDEDLVIRSSAQCEDMRNVRTLLRELLVNCVQQNAALNQALLTGVFDLQIANFSAERRTSVGAVGGDNEVRYNLMDPEFSDYYGLDQYELDDLLNGPFRSVFKPGLRKALREWYVYNFRGREHYSYRSIVRFLSNGGKFDIYWSDRAEACLAEYVLSTDSIQPIIQNYTDGEIASGRVREQLKLEEIARESTVLFFSGFLSVAIIEYDFSRPWSSELCAANLETRDLLASKVKRWLSDKLFTDENAFVEMATDLTSFNITEFRKKLSRLMQHALPTPVFPIGVMKSITRSFGDDHVVETNLPPESPKQSVWAVAKNETKLNTAVLVEYEVAANGSVALLNLELAAKRIVNGTECDLNRERYPYIKRLCRVAVVFFGKQFGLHYCFGH